MLFWAFLNQLTRFISEENTGVVIIIPGVLMVNFHLEDSVLVCQLRYEHQDYNLGSRNFYIYFYATVTGD